MPTRYKTHTRKRTSRRKTIRKRKTLVGGVFGNLFKKKNPYIKGIDSYLTTYNNKVLLNIKECIKCEQAFISEDYYGDEGALGQQQHTYVTCLRPHIKEIIALQKEKQVVIDDAKGREEFKPVLKELDTLVADKNQLLNKEKFKIPSSNEKQSFDQLFDSYYKYASIDARGNPVDLNGAPTNGGRKRKLRRKHTSKR